jgi:hypothetical protein
MGKNALAPTANALHLILRILKKKWITNKTKCGVGIMRME